MFVFFFVFFGLVFNLNSLSFSFIELFFDFNSWTVDRFVVCHHAENVIKNYNLLAISKDPKTMHMYQMTKRESNNKTKADLFVSSSLSQYFTSEHMNRIILCVFLLTASLNKIEFNSNNIHALMRRQCNACFPSYYFEDQVIPLVFHHLHFSFPFSIPLHFVVSNLCSQSISGSPELTPTEGTKKRKKMSPTQSAIRKLNCFGCCLSLVLLPFDSACNACCYQIPSRWSRAYNQILFGGGGGDKKNPGQSQDIHVTRREKRIDLETNKILTLKNGNQSISCGLIYERNMYISQFDLMWTKNQINSNG